MKFLKYFALYSSVAMSVGIVASIGLILEGKPYKSDLLLWIKVSIPTCALTATLKSYFPKRKEAIT